MYADLDPELYSTFSLVLYSILCTVTDGDAKGILRGMAEKGWALDGFKGLMLLRGLYDVRTGATLLKNYTEVVSPPGIRSVHDVVSKINNWEGKLGNLKENYQEDLSNRMRMAILVGMLDKK